jgi:anti-sigma factor RsiW
MSQVCPNIPQISAYHDGELAGEQREQIERHLRDCPQCAAELDELRRLSQQLAEAAPRPALSLEAARRLHDHVEELTDRSVLHFAEILSGLAAAVMLAASLWTARPASVAAEPVAPWEQAIAMVPQDQTSRSPIRTVEWFVSELSPDDASDADRSPASTAATSQGR